MTSSQNLGSGDKSKRQSNTVYRRLSIKKLNERTCFDKFKSDRKAFNRHSTSLSIESQGESYRSRKVNIPKETIWMKYRFADRFQARAIFISWVWFEVDGPKKLNRTILKSKFPLSQALLSFVSLWDRPILYMTALQLFRPFSLSSLDRPL